VARKRTRPPILAPEVTCKPNETPQKALEQIHGDYRVWTKNLTDSSFQLSLGLLGANWAAFQQVGDLVNNLWAKWSVILVVIGLLVNLMGALLLSEMLRRRHFYAEADLARWEREHAAAPSGPDDPWPSTKGLDEVAAKLRLAKVIFPVLSAILFLCALG
jgi:hypothetical protein